MCSVNITYDIYIIYEPFAMFATLRPAGAKGRERRWKRQIEGGYFTCSEI